MWGIAKLSDLSTAMGNLGVIDLSSPNPSVDDGANPSAEDCNSDDIFSTRPLPPLPADVNECSSAGGLKLPKPFGAPADGRSAMREINSAERGGKGTAVERTGSGERWGKGSAVEKTEKSAAASQPAAAAAKVPEPRRTPRKRASARPPANDEATAPSVENNITSRPTIQTTMRAPTIQAVRRTVVPPVPPPIPSAAPAAVRLEGMPPSLSVAPAAVRPKPVPLFATPSTPPAEIMPDPEVTLPAPCSMLSPGFAELGASAPERPMALQPEPEPETSFAQAFRGAASAGMMLAAIRERESLCGEAFERPASASDHEEEDEMKDEMDEDAPRGVVARSRESSTTEATCTPTSDSCSSPPPLVFATPPLGEDVLRTEGESANASSTAPQSGVAPGGGGGTLIVFDQVFFAHNTSKGCQECPARVEVLMGRAGLLRDTTNSVGRGRVSFEEHVEPARLADILRVHDWEYIGQLASRCAKGNSDNSPMGTLDPPGHPQDTSFSAQSYLVARTAAGAVCKAVDRVMRGEQRNAFVASRPPGHHAGPRGLVHTDDGRPSLSQGFCLINNVAVGAAYAKYNYPEAKRIAIVDFDVHNGDGTAACVRNLKPHLETRRVGAGLSVTNTVYKPWLDESDGENVFFASVHLVAENFYPQVASQGYNQAGSTSWPEFEAFTTGATNDPAEPTILNVPLEKTTTKAESSQMFRERILEKLIPKLNDFQPDLLFISAGFDGHDEDERGNKGMSHLLEDDYEWVTHQLVQVAETWGQGRVVSVLEGGYHVQRTAAPLPRNSRRKSSAVLQSASAPLPGALATCVAAHVAALANPKPPGFFGPAV
eukprot:CAMPEP_0180134828 /NCGR_PEP_ID=MMETSP0986-20121125/10413_1 /TAXON_ID=697907 /ORGANISM="non described non described, Strain CCMP2293" /LENGTH=828 /DNA_ID=CAMNT_0022075301 /DNA_START=51 /DNA_END=2537 /DNA_ORIENTATION=-